MPATLGPVRRARRAGSSRLFTYLGATAVDRYLTDNAAGSADSSGERLQALAALSSYRTVFWVAAAIFLAGAAVTAALFRPGPQVVELETSVRER